LRVNVVLLKWENIPELSAITDIPEEELRLKYKEYEARNQYCMFTTEMSEDAYKLYKLRGF